MTVTFVLVTFDTHLLTMYRVSVRLIIDPDLSEMLKRGIVVPPACFAQKLAPISFRFHLCITVLNCAVEVRCSLQVRARRTALVGSGEEPV